jgi:DNA-binding NarL/FixJ family response regulator
MERELENQRGSERPRFARGDNNRPPRRPKPAAEPPELLDLAYREEWTPREREVAALVIRGCRNKEIATELGISEQAVKHLLHNVRQDRRQEPHASRHVRLASGDPMSPD